MQKVVVRSSSVRQGKTPAGEIPSDWPEMLRSWRLWAQARDLSPGSIDLYSRNLLGFFRWLRDGLGWTGSLESLTVEHLRHYLVGLQEQGLSASTRLSYRSAIRSLWKFMREDDFVGEDMFLSGRIPRPKLEDKVVPILDAHELERLYKAAAADPYLAARDQALLAVLEDSGLRVSELCDLTLDDVNWENWVLFVRHGKGRRQRMVALGATAMRLLDKYVKNWRRRRIASRAAWAEPHERLFISRVGEPLATETVRSRLKVLAKRAGLDPARVHPHVLRHVAATRLADAGMSELELRSLFGWSKESGMTARYTASTTAARAIASHRRLSPLDNRRRRG